MGGNRMMNKRALKAVFSNAKAVGARYVGVRIETAGSSQPEIIINPRENRGTRLRILNISITK